MIQDIEDIGLRYVIRLVVTHPAMDLRCVGDWLGLEPSREWLAGAAVSSEVSAPQRRQYSYWCYRLVRRNHRYFSGDVSRLASLIDESKHKLIDLQGSGGALTMVIELEGTRSIGDELESTTLAQLSAAGCKLGIELFPAAQG